MTGYIPVEAQECSNITYMLCTVLTTAHMASAIKNICKSQMFMWRWIHAGNQIAITHHDEMMELDTPWWHDGIDIWRKELNLMGKEWTKILFWPYVLPLLDARKGNGGGESLGGAVIWWRYEERASLGRWVSDGGVDTLKLRGSARECCLRHLDGVKSR